MEAKVPPYIPYCFRNFQGFFVKDIKESIIRRHMEIHLEVDGTIAPICNRCGEKLSHNHSQYLIRARHLRVFNWTVEVCFYRRKSYCEHCKKIRSEHISFLCPTTPHITLELAWWINRLSEITAVLQVSKLESIDKMSCYKVDKYILKRLLQGYQIPEITHISVDEVYARSNKQKQVGETRDDLFLTVIVDLKTRKVIWVSQSRRKEALDAFFEVLGPDGCNHIEVVATDQHEGYGASVRYFCPDASLVWDRFHLVQKFNELLNEERKTELEKLDREGKIGEQMGDLMNGKYRYVFLQKAINRSKLDKEHMNKVVLLNKRMMQLEIIKETFHKIFDCTDIVSAQIKLGECYEWAWQVKASGIVNWILSIRDRSELWSYIEHRVTTSISEGINRVIKGIKWQAYGYVDMEYFALKIMQKAGYLNHSYALKLLFENRE